MITIIIINFREGFMATLKYSKQRECIKRFLMNCTDHPTADNIYESVRKEFPNISLGTVYRNLALLTSLGEIRKLSYDGGPDHYDADTSPHYHFNCKICGRVRDVSLEITDDLNLKAEEVLQVKVDEHRINFYGVCQECLKTTDITAANKQQN